MTEIKPERRYTTWTVEYRADRTKADEQGRIGGYAAVFRSLSQNLGGFVEEVTPEFFNKSRGDGWPGVVARFNHDDNMLLGTTAGGTLRLMVDSTGLDYTVDPPASRRDISELVARGDVTKSSFAFRTFEDEWGLTDQNFPKRTLVSGALIDVAPVVTPAYLDTSAGLRSLAVKVGAEVEEVRSLAEQNELRKFFIRTDRPSAPAKPKTRGHSALTALLAKKTPPGE